MTLTEGYWLSRFPVTNADYLHFVQAMGVKPAGSFSNARFNHPAQPVVEVDFAEATTFCDWLTAVSLDAMGRSASLPTEAEWEHAARGTDGRKYPWGDEAPDPDRSVWDLDYTTEHTPRVGGHRAGRAPFGHEEMAGNVREWCRDGWRDDYDDDRTMTNPCHHDDGAARVVRGESWYSVGNRLRCAARSWFRPGRRDLGIGFRVVVRASGQRAHA